MNFPVEFDVFGVTVPAHFVFEALAYAVGFRAYVVLRRRVGDTIDASSRWVLVAAAAVGAAVGSKVLAWLQDPSETWRHLGDAAFLVGGKTIVGGLLGGLVAVELAKRSLGIARRTGDVFAAPLAVGIAIGRIGCFLAGLPDRTYGIATSLPLGVDFGDGMPRHPTQLYELVFCAVLAVLLWRRTLRPHTEGAVFAAFLVAYLAFRLAIDFLKPGSTFLGLTAIQWACAGGLVHYLRVVQRLRPVTSQRDG